MRLLLFRSLACFHMDEFETAKVAFSKAVDAAGEGAKQLPVYRKWIRKCDAELDSACGVLWLMCPSSPRWPAPPPPLTPCRCALYPLVSQVMTRT